MTGLLLQTQLPRLLQNQGLQSFLVHLANSLPLQWKGRERIDRTFNTAQQVEWKFLFRTPQYLGLGDKQTRNPTEWRNS